MHAWNAYNYPPPSPPQSEAKQRAEVDVFYKRFDEAERAYLEMDRRYAGAPKAYKTL